MGNRHSGPQAGAELGGRWSSPISDASLSPAAAGTIGESGCVGQDGFEGLEVSTAEMQEPRTGPESLP